MFLLEYEERNVAGFVFYDVCLLKKQIQKRAGVVNEGRLKTGSRHHKIIVVRKSQGSGSAAKSQGRTVWRCFRF